MILSFSLSENNSPSLYETKIQLQLVLEFLLKPEVGARISKRSNGCFRNFSHNKEREHLILNLRQILWVCRSNRNPAAYFGKVENGEVKGRELHVIAKTNSTCVQCHGNRADHWLRDRATLLCRCRRLFSSLRKTTKGEKNNFKQDFRHKLYSYTTLLKSCRRDLGRSWSP